MAVADAPRAERTSALTVLERSLVVVTGKGGTGKTTVAATLAHAAGRQGGRAVVCEVGGAHRLDGSISIDPHDALDEWMRTQPGGALAAAVLGRSAAFAHFVDAAPGAKELVTVGKCASLARGDDWDVVIVDAPSTGHALGMLSTAGTVGRIAPHGPVGNQARELHDYLADPERTALVGVSLPEEMSVNELVDLDDGLCRALGRGLDLVVVNGVYPKRFTPAEAEHLRALAGRSSAIRAALHQYRQAEVHAARTDRLRTRIAAPVVTLPFLFDVEIARQEPEALAALDAALFERRDRRA